MYIGFGDVPPPDPPPPTACTYPLSATLEQLQGVDPSIDYRLALSEGDQRGAFQVGGEDATYAAAPTTFDQSFDLTTGQRQIAVRFELPTIEIGSPSSAPPSLSVMAFRLFSPSAGVSVDVDVNLKLTTPPGTYTIDVGGPSSTGGILVSAVAAGVYEVTLLVDADAETVSVMLDGSPVTLDTPIDNFVPADDYIILCMSQDYARLTDDSLPNGEGSEDNLGAEFAVTLLTDTAQMAYPFEDVPDACGLA